MPGNCKITDTDMILREPEIYYAAACLIMVCSSLFCAMVRYFHMCRPFDEYEVYVKGLNDASQASIMSLNVVRS